MDIFVVVNEDNFGGENKFIRTFSSKENAINYLRKVNNGKEMQIILTTKLDSEEIPKQEEADYE